MAFIVRPMFGLGTNRIGAGIDGFRKITLDCFGYAPDSCLANAFPYVHQGRGDKLVRCEVSGEYFPSTRIRRQWDGKQVGDVYLQQPPRTWPLR